MLRKVFRGCFAGDGVVPPEPGFFTGSGSGLHSLVQVVSDTPAPAKIDRFFRSIPSGACVRMTDQQILPG